jgi:hypothetical protein
MKTKKATVLPAAGKSELRIEPYQKSEPLSNLKLKIGELLLFGNKQHSEFWSLFEVLLIQYIELKYLGDRP